MGNRYINGMINSMGTFEPVGLEAHATLASAHKARRWSRIGGDAGVMVGLVLKEPGHITLGTGSSLKVVNSGYTAEAFEAFLTATWGAK